MIALIIIIIIIVSIFAVIVIESKKPNEQSQQQATHFDLLDDSRNPIKPKLNVSVIREKEVNVRSLVYFSIKDKGYHLSVWPKDSNNWLPGLDYVEFNIAGMSHQDNIDNYMGEHVGKLMTEPTNPFDANAIKILAKDGHQVGYVPKDMTSSVRKFTNLPCKCYFYIGENDGTYFSSCYITK